MPLHFLPHEARLQLELTAQPDPEAVGRLEERIRRHYGKSFAVAVGDLHHAILALGLALELGPGDEVVVSPIEARGLAALSLCGATLVPAMLSNCDLLITDVHLADALTDRTRMVLVPHTGGLEPDLHALQRIAADHGGPMLASLTGLCTSGPDGTPPANLAEVVVVDLGRGRAITAGQGAMLLMDNADLHARLLRVVAPLSRQWASGIEHLNAANLECPLPASAALLLERTLDHQVFRLTDKQRRLHTALERHRRTFITWPFDQLGTCTFEDTLLCLDTLATTPMEPQQLRYHYQMSQRFRPFLQWRVPEQTAELLNVLAKHYTYYRLEDVVRKQWPCY